MTGTASIPSAARFGFVYDSPYQSTLDAVYVFEVPWSDFPIIPSYPNIFSSAIVGLPRRPLLPSLPTQTLTEAGALLRRLRFGVWGSGPSTPERGEND